MGIGSRKIINDFGKEWSTYSQEELADTELSKRFVEYFNLVDLMALPSGCVAADIGCGSGRWAKLAHQYVETLYCVEPSSAIEIAKRNLSGTANVRFIQSEVASMPIAGGSLDFLYCIGVLHHLPDVEAGIRACASKLKPGGKMLAYIYYRFDGRPFWYVMLWRVSDTLRTIICRLPHPAKVAITTLIASLVYLPLALISGLLKRLGVNAENVPLSYYSDKSFYTMRTDALDRFGTSLEKRFSKAEIRAMFLAAGFEQIAFSPDAPYWCVIGTKP